MSHMGRKQPPLKLLRNLGSDTQIKCLDKTSALKNPFGLLHNRAGFVKELNVLLFMKLSFYYYWVTQME